MNTLLWVLQVLLAMFAAFTGATHLILPSSLPAPLQWMYDLPAPIHVFAGTAEVLAALGLILPGLTRIQTRLTALAALGFVLVMGGAVVFHARRGEISNILINIGLAALAGFIAYGRWRVRPLPERKMGEARAKL